MQKNKIHLKINKSENILLITHTNPDGDALGSLLAMGLAFRKMGKNINMVCPDKTPVPFKFLYGVDDIKHDFLLGDYDLIVILDCGDLRRTGFADRLKEFNKIKNKIINIDHHPKNDLHRIASINLIDYNASSTAEIVFELIKELNVDIDKNMATSLLCGLYTDTGAFKHSNTSSKVLYIASELLKKGARLKNISDNITVGKSVAALKLWGLVLSRIQSNKNNGLISSFVTYKDLVDCKATQSDLAGVVNMINTIPNTKAAILFSEIEDGKIKASLRTESDKVDVSKLAQIFGGGGLKKASGFVMDGKIVFKDNKWLII